jgi:hypothetical protein
VDGEIKYQTVQQSNANREGSLIELSSNDALYSDVAEEGGLLISVLTFILIKYAYNKIIIRA